VALYKYFLENTIIGGLTVIADDSAITKITFGIDNVSDIEIKNTDLIKYAIKELLEYFDSRRKNFTVPLNFIGTEFQLKVWNELLKIQYGEVKSYEGIAKCIKNAFSYRAVGTACKNNNLPIFVPCHRVICKNGGLGGYFGGVNKKISLLQLEGVSIRSGV
jgi:methylated-DNA-[protein]-cysteine S-methyltransferase